MYFIVNLFLLSMMLSRVSSAVLRNHGTLRLNSLKMSTNTGKAPYQLVLVRHGESTWNQENKFTGWYDCPLSVKGKKFLESMNYSFDL